MLLASFSSEVLLKHRGGEKMITSKKTIFACPITSETQKISKRISETSFLKPIKNRKKSWKNCEFFSGSSPRHHKTSKKSAQRRIIKKCIWKFGKIHRFPGTGYYYLARDQNSALEIQIFGLGFCTSLSGLEVWNNHNNIKSRTENVLI